MHRKLKILFLIAIISHINWLQAQTLSNRGKEFWVGYGHHQFMETDNSQEMVLYFSAEAAAHVIVTINGTTYKEEYDVAAGSVIPSKLIPKGLESTPASFYDARLYTRPPSYPGGTGSEGVFKNQAIHIESDVPIVVYAHIYGDLSSGASMLMPVETWGYSYISVNTPQFYNGSNYNCFSWMYVVAKQNNTRIRIVPTVNTRKGDRAGIPITVDLQKGEIYQLVGAPIDQEAGENVAGSTVTSIANSVGECYPIALFSGSSRTQITCLGANNGSGDNIMQQVFPLQAWGKHYLTAPTSVDLAPKNHNLNIFRIIVKDPSTIVKKNGTQMLALTTSNGYYYEYQSDKADYIEADKPVLVAQYIPSASSCGYVGAGDPEMMLISPMEQSIKRVGFYRNNKEKIDYNFLTLIVPTEGVASLKIDGVNGGFDDVYNHPNYAGYSVVVKRWKAAQAQTIVESDSAFTAITYGLGGAESYGYNAGTYINNLNGFPALNNEHSPVAEDNKYTCVNTPVKLSVLMRYKPTVLNWKLSELAGTISPAANVIQNNPVSTATVMVNGLPYYRYSLPGYYSFNKVGTHSISLFATSPTVETCDQTEQVKYEVEVKPGYSTDFNIIYNNCSLSENIQFTGRDIFSNSDSIKNWQWIFPDNTTATGKTASHVFAAGTHSVRLLAVDSVGCIADTTKSFNLAAKPQTPDFKINSTDSCAGAIIQLADINPEAGVKQWYWDFGGNDTLSINGSSALSKQFTRYDTLLVKHVTRFSADCVSDTATRTIVIYAKPGLSIVNPSGCMIGTGITTFVNQSTTADGQAITKHSWNFGDAAATPANPNTSIANSPSHIYSAAGDYTISYQAVTEKGCVADSSIKLSLQPLPQLEYAAISGVCVNAGNISVAFAKEKSGLTGSGIYSGIATTTTGAFDPKLAGVGVHTIKFIFTSASGCKDSVSQTITVKAAPTAAFTVSKNICTDSAASFSQQSSVANGSISSWHWNYGDGTKEDKNNGADFARVYQQTGVYSASLSVDAANGCSSDTVKAAVEVHVLPVASFTVPASVCLPSGKAQFTNSSSIADGSVLSYTWQFGDNKSSTQKDPLHSYNAAGSYNVTLSVRNAMGCAANATAVVDKFYDQPIAAFSVNSSEVCQGVASVFTDASTAPNSSIASRHWEYGDGIVSSSAQPSKTYTQPGTYNVKLVVTSAAGCVSDTAYKTVKVYLQPMIDAGKSFVVKEGTIIRLEATANASSLSFVWSPATGLDNPQTLRPVLRVMNDGVYTLTATSEHNCVAKDDLKVTVQKGVVIPNAFSPNGDGINDVWMLRNIQQYAASSIEIYDRYGAIVFRGIGTANPWDGTSKGKPLPVGAYYYLVNLKDGSPVIQGSVSLIR